MRCDNIYSANYTAIVHAPLFVRSLLCSKLDPKNECAREVVFSIPFCSDVVRSGRPSFAQFVVVSLLLAAPRPPAEQSAGTNEGDEETDEEGDGVASSVPSVRRRDERSEDDQEERDEDLQLHASEKLLCPRAASNF